MLPPDIPDPLDVLDPLNPACDPLDPSACLFPFPSDHWTVADPSTATGRRVDLPLAGMPRNVAGVPVDPAEWNRNDGFSPGSALLTHVPGLDLTRTWDLGGRPDRYRAHITDPATSLAPDAPIVLVDATTGERHPFWSELDTHPDTPPSERTLIIRPAENLRDGHRYVVGLADLRRADGSRIRPGPTFAALRAGEHGGERQRHYDRRIFPVLTDAGVERDDLVLAWDLTVVSADNLAGRVLAMRDQTFAALGDTELDDGVVDGTSPSFTVESVEANGGDDPTWRIVDGTVQVPNYLTLPDETNLDIPEVGTFAVPGARLNYASPAPAAGATPVVNALDPTRDVPFVCSIPRTVLAGERAAPSLYGHGLLGSRTESLGGSTEGLRRNGYMPCSIDWTGMSTGDLPNVALILADIGRFPSLADRGQQGFLEWLVFARAIVHPDGLSSHPAFQRDGQPVFDPDRLVYDGNSQGAIMGGALAALGVDFTRATLGVPGMNYSTLLNRSADWEGAYGEVSYAFYPNKREQQLLFGLLQMLWDRAETSGYAGHVTADPLPDTPAKQVLLQVGFGDHQVANVSAEVEARTFGARRIPTDLPVCRHWALDPMFGFEPNDEAAQHPSVLAYFDSGTPTPPNGNLAPIGLGEDPHEDPRRDPAAIVQKVTFFETGRVLDVADGGHARSYVWPEKAGEYLAEVEAQLEGDCLVTAGTQDPAVTPVVDDPRPPSGTLPATGTDTRHVLALALVAAAVVLRSRPRRHRPRSPGPTAARSA